LGLGLRLGLGLGLGLDLGLGLGLVFGLGLLVGLALNSIASACTRAYASNTICWGENQGERKEETRHEMSERMRNREGGLGKRGVKIMFGQCLQFTLAFTSKGICWGGTTRCKERKKQGRVVVGKGGQNHKKCHTKNEARGKEPLLRGEMVVKDMGEKIEGYDLLPKVGSQLRNSIAIDQIPLKKVTVGEGETENKK
jgi:hypothetical protein